MKKLAEVFQHNQQVFTGGFELVEMHHFVERRVLNDMFKGTVRFTDPVLEVGQTADDVFAPTEAAGGYHYAVPARTDLSKIDWDWYYAEFKRCVKDDVAKGVLEFCDIKLKVAEPEAPAPEEPAVASEHAAPDMVFGGDYAGQQVG